MQIKNHTSLSQRLLGAVDLAIDFATLGEYGLEELPANTAGEVGHDGPCRERPGLRAGWEAPAAGRRRGSCRSSGWAAVKAATH